MRKKINQIKESEGTIASRERNNKSKPSVYEVPVHECDKYYLERKRKEGKYYTLEFTIFALVSTHKY